MNVLVIGASRGIGLELVRQHRAAHCRVVATARDEAGLARLAALGAVPLRLDVTDLAACAGFGWALDGEAFDTVWFVAGVLNGTQGEQDAPDAPTQGDFDAVMHTNVLAPMRLLPLAAQALKPGGRMALLSSKMGSIGQRSNGGSWLYRASKAAANSVLKDLSFAFAGKALCLSLHPGWVRTDMGGADADIDVATSVAGLCKVVAHARPEDHGGFFNYDGQPLAW
ncbi:MAG: short-chain dehydrogenase [Methylibium sp. NZG]|nr:MAG: short-chain dehydrogenase [Methylibium sp. NZG]